MASGTPTRPTIGLAQFHRTSDALGQNRSRWLWVRRRAPLTAWRIVGNQRKTFQRGQDADHGLTHRTPWLDHLIRSRSPPRPISAVHRNLVTYEPGASGIPRERSRSEGTGPAHRSPWSEAATPGGRWNRPVSSGAAARPSSLMRVLMTLHGKFGRSSL
jgi:hypothetical protein